MESTGWDAPRAEFRAWDFRRIARDKLRGNWGLALGTSLVFMICGVAAEMLASGMSTMVGTGTAFSFVSFFEGITPYESLSRFGAATPVLVLYSVFSLAFALAATAVTSALTLGHNQFYVDLCNNHADFSTLFSRFRVFFKAFGLMLFIGLFVFLWSLLLFVPGIIAAYRYRLAPYLMAQHPEMGIREAVNESKRLMAGHKGRLFCLDLSFIGWAILCALSFGIGYLWLIPYMQAADAAFYLDRSGQGIPLNAR